MNSLTPPGHAHLVHGPADVGRYYVKKSGQFSQQQTQILYKCEHCAVNFISLHNMFPCQILAPFCNNAGFPAHMTF
jgi:hypothetical protein